MGWHILSVGKVLIGEFTVFLIFLGLMHKVLTDLKMLNTHTIGIQSVYVNNDLALSSMLI